MRLWKLGFLAVLAGLLTRSVRQQQSGDSKQFDRLRRDGRSRVDEAGLESFPASDPPSWTLGEEAGDR